MELVYISGKYRAPSVHGMRVNIARAEAIAMKYWKLGYGVVCPHKNTEFMDNDEVSDEIFLLADFKIIRRCIDIMVMVPGWKDSDGAKKEHEYAKSLGIPIIYETESTIKNYFAQCFNGTISMIENDNMKEKA